MFKNTVGRATAGVLLVALALVGCGNDDDDAATDPIEVEQPFEDDAQDDVVTDDEVTDDTADMAAVERDPVRYCQLASEVDNQEEPPTEEQLTTLEQVAPDEIAEDARVYVQAVRTGDFEGEGVADAEDRLVTWENENCNGEAGDADDGTVEVEDEE